MDKIIRSYLEVSEFARTADELCGAIANVIQLLDCHGFAYLTLPTDANETPFLLSNYDVRWTTQYQDRRYHLRDPVTRQARRLNRLFAWTPDIVNNFDPAARDLFAEADTFGIRCGITVPVVRGSSSLAAMTFVTDIKHLRYRSCLLGNEVAFQFLAQHSHERLQRFKQSSYTMNGVAFTRREHECLEWASRGKSRRDIAVITGLSFRQVVRDLERTKAKLGVRTTTQAVKIYAADKVNRGIL